MQKKIKVLDLAKDLNLDNNKIIDVIAKYGNGSTRKKPSSAVSEEEINIVLEHLTQNNQVASFDSYLASKNSKEGDTTNNNNNNRKNFSQSNDNQRGNNSKQEQPRKDFNNNRKRTN